MKRQALCASVVAIALATIAVAQPPDLSGTWRLNRAASNIDPAAGLVSLGQGGAPNTLYISVAANNTVGIGSDINESQARLYRIGAESDIPMAPEATARLTTRWENGTLVAEGEQAARGSQPGLAVHEAFALGADRRTLTVTVTLTGADGPKTSTLVYEAITSAGPCTSWPTPCRP